VGRVKDARRVQARHRGWLFAAGTSCHRDDDVDTLVRLTTSLSRSATNAAEAETPEENG
jgi:hypothetical protein